MSLKQQTTAAFRSAFQYDASHFFHAPGRVNLIGEHTDYNDGFVLPAAINFGTSVSISPRTDSTVRVCAVNFDHQISEFHLGNSIDKSISAPWSNYVRGVCQELSAAGFSLTGADIAIAGDVPYGAGLSSSAALEVVIARAMVAVSKGRIEPQQAALLGQAAENNYIGANTGIMDQLIIAQAIANHALLIDCRDLSSKPVPLPQAMRIVIFNSNVKRGLVDSEYNQRRAQCQNAADALGVTHLRDASLSMLERSKSTMNTETYRRAHHVISENDRTLEAAQALEEQDWFKLSNLMAQSHQSMRDDFEITVPPIDGIVELVHDCVGNSGGVRMTGGGFGGCVVSLLPADSVKETIQWVNKHYFDRFGIQETVYICDAVDGAFVS